MGKFNIVAEYKNGSFLIARDMNDPSTYHTAYSRKAIRQAWKSKKGKFQAHARARENFCIVVPIEEEKALVVVAAFAHWYRDCSPSQTHYDGETLSIYCGHKMLKKQIETMLFNLTFMVDLVLKDLDDAKFFAEDYL